MFLFHAQPTRALQRMPADSSEAGWPWVLLLTTGLLALLLSAVVTWAAKAPVPPGVDSNILRAHRPAARRLARAQRAHAQYPARRTRLLRRVHARGPDGAGSSGGHLRCAEGDAGLLKSLLQQLKSDADERREEAALRFVQVRRWDGPVSAVVQLRLTYGAFFASALAAVRVTGAARLYTFKDENWETRQPLTEATYAALVELSRDLCSSLPDIFIFEPIPGAQTATSSPGEPPWAVRPVQDAEVEETCSSRSTAVQNSFKRMLLCRDGEKCACALCSERPVEAAHVIPRIASTELLRRARLPGADTVSNGIFLCPDCHFMHDQFMWHYLPSTGVVVADALASDSELGPLWRARAGMHLTRPEGELQASWWPPEAVWRAAYAGFEAAREARHAFADENLHSCLECDWRGKTARGLQKHHCSRVKTKLFTPLPLRQAAGGGGGRERSRSAE